MTKIIIFLLILSYNLFKLLRIKIYLIYKLLILILKNSYLMFLHFMDFKPTAFSNAFKLLKTILRLLATHQNLQLILF